MTNHSSIKPKERAAILDSLRAGVVPRIGQRHIQVGRAREVEALVQNIDRISEGGSAIRFVIGEYGSGKTFFLNLIRSIALEKKLVALHADLTVDRRLQSTGGHARSLYAELVRNASTRAKPDGNALPSIVERFVTSAMEEAEQQGCSPQVVIQERIKSLNELLGGYDFSQVILAFWRGHDTGNETLKSDALRWLRGEFATKTEARQALGVRVIVEDANIYDQLKLLALFVRLAGYGGILVCLDEMVNLYKITQTQSRNSNYEQILRIVNDCLQGSVSGLGFLFGGTPDFLMDPRRGLYSYPALQSRLSENRFLKDGLADYSGPVLRLPNLTQEELFVLLRNLIHIYANGDARAYLLPEQGIKSFMAHCSQKIGEAYFRTPRTTITSFLSMLAVLEQNPGVNLSDLIEHLPVSGDANPDLSAPDDSSSESLPAQSNDDLTSFKL